MMQEATSGGVKGPTERELTSPPTFPAAAAAEVAVSRSANGIKGCVLGFRLEGFPITREAQRIAENMLRAP